jgi:hypothetical protein
MSALPPKADVPLAEVGQLHSTKSSASDRTDAGIVSPSALAVVIEYELEFDRLLDRNVAAALPKQFPSGFLVAVLLVASGLMWAVIRPSFHLDLNGSTVVIGGAGKDR